MTGPLLEGQFSLLGYTFGHSTDEVVLQKFDPGAADLAINDVQNPSGHGMYLGRDRLGGATYAFDFIVPADDPATAFARARNLAAVWRTQLETTAQAIPLYYCAGGRQLMVYGRPRRISNPTVSVESKQGAVYLAADFTVTDPRVYLADPVSTRLVLAAAQGSIGVGFTLPTTLPLTTGSGTSTRVGTVHNDGGIPVPFTVAIHGPITNPTVTAAGLSVAVNADIPADRSLTVDTRTKTARWENGTSAATLLSRSTRRDALLPAGQSDISFAGIDPTLRSYADFTFHPASFAL